MKKFLNRIFIWSGYGYCTKFKVIKETDEMLTLEVISTTLPFGLLVNERFTNGKFALNNAIIRGNVQEVFKRQKKA